MKVALYARVSTTDQNCAMQLEELQRYCMARNWEVWNRYVDTGWSGAKASRPEFDALMLNAAARRFDAVLVWKMDRFGRSLLNLLHALEQLKSYGVRFLATSQGIDTDESNPTAKLLQHILAAVAEFEREITRERVAAGIQRARANGVRFGRHVALFDREEARRLHADGMPLRAIAKKVNSSPATIQRFLKAR